MKYDDNAPNKPDQMSDMDLCVLIDHERSTGIGMNDQMVTDRERAQAFYMGEPFGELAPPAMDGRSKVVTRDTMETVEWLMPSLMRMFCSMDEVVRFEPNCYEDEQACQDATEYCGYILHRKNDGFTVLHDAIKAALIYRMGVVKVYYERSWSEREIKYEGLSDQDLQALQAQENIDIIDVKEIHEISIAPHFGQQPDPSNGPQLGQPQQPAYSLAQATPQVNYQPVTYNVTVKLREPKDNYNVVGVPPEEIIFSKDSRDISKLRFVCHDVERTRSDLLSMGYDPDLVDTMESWQGNRDTYGEKASRAYYDGVNMADDWPADESQRKCVLSEAYILCDYNGDGISEYRRILKGGNVILENEMVDDHPFALFTPFLMPYKLIGLSLHDLTEELQLINTALTRQYLDNAYLANNPRTIAVLDQVNLDDLLDNRAGGVVRAKSVDAVRELITSPVGAQVLSGIQYFKSVRDSRTGVQDFNQGLLGDELSKSNIGSQGVSLLHDASAQRIDLIARVLAETGIKRIYQLILKMVTQYQNKDEQVRVNGHWMRVDPRGWRDNYGMSVSVGLGNSSKAHQAQKVMQLLQVQQQASQYGLVQPVNAYNALTEMCKQMGYKDATRFFTAPDPNGQPQPNQQADQHQSAMALQSQKLQAESQLAQQKNELDVHLEQSRQQFQSQQQQYEKSLEAQRNQEQLHNQMALEQFRIEKQAELEQFKENLKHQTSIEVARINAEAKIASAKVQGAKDTSTADAAFLFEQSHEQ